MNEIIFYIACFGWILGVSISLGIMSYAFYHRDKESFETGIYVFILFALTGYITFFPLLIAFTLFTRFQK